MSIEDAMKKLGYTTEWLSLGIIQETYLLAQFKEFKQTGFYPEDDPHSEYYRHCAFTHYLESKAKLTDDEISAIFILKDDGPDMNDLHFDRIINLIESDILTTNQLERLAEYPEVLKSPIQKRYLRKKLICKINQTSLDSCFEQVKQSEDHAVFEYVLTRHDLTYEHVQWLTKCGRNKRTRNAAKQMLRSRKFRTAL